jgi:uncharacterized protein (TIGR02145 family)
MITVTAACAAGAASTMPTLTVNTILTNITHSTTSATGIGTASGLPTGVSAAWSANVITISGTPTVTGPFSYTIPLTGTSCSSVNATGTITVSAPPLACGSVTSVIIDGYSYSTVSIGTQCWTNENLKVTTYNDGTAIPLNNTYTSGTVSTVWQGLTTGAYTIYGNESSTGANATNYGFLYNWYAAKGVSTSGSTTYKNICATGWHVPTDSDWNKLVIYLDSGADTSATSSAQSYSAGTLMKKNDALWSVNTGTNTSGFSALPGAYREYNGTFYFIRSYAFFWSATENDSSTAWGRYLNSNSDVNRNNSAKSFGASVRCLRD